MNLFGASGHAKVIIDIIEAAGNSVGVLYDDAPYCRGLCGRPVLKAADTTVTGPMIISIGSNRVRKMISERYPLPYVNAIHPTAIISRTAHIGAGTVVMHGATIQSDSSIGRHCIINTGASVDHECRIGDYVHISPHATLCGNVHVGEGSWIGAGATVVPGIKIGRWCTIGAGAVVIRDIPDGATAYGNPAKIKQ
ncbi:MAG: acetyltransferase [Muribaculaceae bacterium]|nr:acetyltransferase [Muribaculaceae bacterium]